MTYNEGIENLKTAHLMMQDVSLSLLIIYLVYFQTKNAVFGVKHCAFLRPGGESDSPAARGLGAVEVCHRTDVDRVTTFLLSTNLEWFSNEAGKRQDNGYISPKQGIFKKFAGVSFFHCSRQRKGRASFECAPFEFI